ncbi:hypothetical protein DSLASN_48920 [Desulfoluna limicola]|uniref:Type 4 fimbrial biogenesis protein PilX N-terminal domain-containing protein n=1 Tax=Desulfoluna limicola TaxID=2810562 RepID=A0ABM7PNX8_9BACT|nr:pilus assembly PilX N-terminal domain-containing protein [Desulfoluna limicola]BCS99260.1 hypothetical protein DSLASN_48920 [Desulfoluna limicola]
METQRRGVNQEGSVMLVAMLVMLLLTMIGLAATRSSVFEMKMASNQRALDEEFARAEAALNLSIRNFRNLTGVAAVLNDTENPDNLSVSCVQNRSLDDVSLARVEIRRIFLPLSADDKDVAGLSSQANAVPELSHRFYDGSIDRKRFAITATAMRRGTSTPSSTWIQKGLALPAEQDRDLF